MSAKCISIGVVGIFLGLLPLGVRAQDLAAQYGTKSQEAAKLLSEGIELVQASKLQEGLQQISAALSVDPSFQMAMYWKGIAYQDLGGFDKIRFIETDAYPLYLYAISTKLRGSENATEWYSRLHKPPTVGGK